MSMKKRLQCYFEATSSSSDDQPGGKRAFRVGWAYLQIPLFDKQWEKYLSRNFCQPCAHESQGGDWGIRRSYLLLPRLQKDPHAGN